MFKSNLKRIGFLLFLVSATITSLAQGPSSVWYFGSKAGMQFQGGTANPTKLNNSAMNLGNYNGEGMASICDNSGNLLFYTDGVTVYGSNHVMVTNGNGLNGNTSSTQTALIIPVPGAKNAAGNYTRFYIFSTPGEEASFASGTGTADALNGVRYSIMDVTTNTITTKNIRLTPAGIPFTEAQTGVPHYDGTSFWLICKQAGNKTTGAGSNSFYAYRIGTNNINATTGVINSLNGTADEVISSPAGARMINGIVAGCCNTASSNGIITMKVNSCFTKIAVAYFSIAKEVQVFNFSNSTGVITLSTTITDFDAADPNEVYGLEFSPDGNLLYATVMFFSSAAETAGRGKIYQFSSAGGPRTAMHPISAAVSSNGIGALQLGEDGRIYYAHYDNNPTGGGTATSFIGRIDNPNTSGSPTWTDAYITWTTAADPGTAVKMGLPQVYRGFLAGTANITSTLSNLEEICLGDWVDFTATTLVPVVSYTWHIDKNLNSVVDYTTGPTINHLYGAAGTYTVEVTVRDACGYDNTSSSQVKVLPKINSAGTASCGPPITGTVTSPNGAYSYVWYSDAAATTAIASGTSATLPVTGTGNVYLKATSGATTNNYTLANGPGSAPNDGDAGTGTVTLDFTVNKAVLTFGTFDWMTKTPNWAASPNSVPVTITITNTATSAVVYTRTQNVVSLAPSGSGVVYTENVNTMLSTGTYRITLSGTGVTFRNTAGWNGCSSNQSDAQSALTYNSASSGGCAATHFTYTLSNVTTTPLACSQTSAAIPFNCPLPVTWVSFKGAHVNGGNNLVWVTATEIGASYFDVERSVDGVNFEYIGRVNAAGNSNRPTTYTYRDATEISGVIYYRLRQVDIDGTGNFSSTIAVNSAASEAYVLLPNPGDGIVFLTGGNPEEQLSVSILDVQGRTIQTNINAHSGSALDLTGLSKGVYLVQVISSGAVQTLRYVLQ